MVSSLNQHALSSAFCNTLVLLLDLAFKQSDRDNQLYASYAMSMSWKRSFGVVILAANIAWGQNAVETSLYLSFNKNGPIAVGKIASLHIAQQSNVSEIGTLSLDITEQLRGDPLPSRFEVRFGWVDQIRRSS